MPTETKQRREMILGGGIILGLIALAVGVFLLEPFLHSLKQEDEIIAVLPEAPKLTTGAEVWIAGKRVGQVTRVAFMPFRGDSLARIAVTMQFPHSVHYLIREDSHIRLTSARIIGAPVIDISPGSPSSALISHGDTLFMDQLVTVITLHAKALRVVASLDSAMLGVKSLAGPAKARMAALAPVMRNMSAAQAELTSIMQAMHNGGASEFMRNGQLMAEVASLQHTAAALGPAFANARANMAGVTGTGNSSLQKLQENAQRMSAAIAQLQKLMQENNGTLYRMGADSALLKTLHATKAQLDSLIIEAKKNPLKFVM